MTSNENHTSREFAHSMSPLEMLERKSRHLALDDDDESPGKQMTPRSSKDTIRPVIDDNSAHPMALITKSTRITRQTINDSGEWDPSDQMSVYSSAESSINSEGILDSFRLSSLPGYDPDAVSLYSVESRQSTVPGDYRVNPRGSRVFERHSPTPSMSSTISSTSTIRQPLSETNSDRAPIAPPHMMGKRLSNASITSIDSTLSSMSSTYTPRKQFVPPSSTNKSTSPQTQLRKSNYFFPDRKTSRGAGPHQLLTPPTLQSHRGQGHTQLPAANWRQSLDGSFENQKFTEISLEDHVSAGIVFHEKGSSREGSYHWQYAAFKGDSTAQLLYGLALRHGWGVRSNPEEAVTWLRKAMEGFMRDQFENGTSTAGTGNRRQAVSMISRDDTKIKRSHVGLALYELGMSYLHSWGLEKDEVKALHTFELAGEFGDTDALCEAASLYMRNGPKGRKKDLVKAAKLYRQAEELGADLVGLSWIYKDKYMDTKSRQKARELRKSKK